MRIHHFKNKEHFIGAAADLLIQEIDGNPGLLMCTATGSSPLPVYRALVEDAKIYKERYNKLRIIKLDEWVGLENQNGSCEAYLQKELIAPLEIPDKNYIAFNARTTEPTDECLRIGHLLNQHGPIDLCVLGLGKNGHLGFNEPPASPAQKCHVARLSQLSQEHSMVAGQAEKPEYGMTLGIRDILNSKKVLLLVSGEGKEEAKKQLLSSKVDPMCPASLLWKHPNVDCFILNENPV
ncbi:galactosamine-6-phosphate isomerase [Flagellimonas sp. 2504JD4-2]